MNREQMTTRQDDQILKKLVEINSLTHKLKIIAYSMANIPLQALKHNPSLSSSTLLTAVDSIYFDLKRIQTILSKYSNNGRQQNGNYEQNYRFSNPLSEINYQGNQAKIREFETFNVESFHLSPISYETNVGKQKTLRKEQSIPQLNLKNDQFQVKQYSFEPRQVSFDPRQVPFEGQQINFEPREVSEYGSSNHNSKFISKGVSSKVHKRKRSHEIGITQVSSYEYVGLSQNPTIKGRLTKITDSQMNPSDGNKSSVKGTSTNYNKNKKEWEKDVFEQEMERDEENEKFLRELSKSRDKILRSIERKKAKCMNAIKNMGSTLMVELSPQHESKLKKSKWKSKTEKFYTQEAKVYNSNQYEHEDNGLEEFVAI